MIDDSMPRGLDPIVQVLPPWRQVRSVTVPLTDEPLTIDAQLDGPGQLLVAVDGVVVTNDGEYLYDPQRTGPWQEADPHLVAGYLKSFGAPASHFSSLNRAAMEQMGIVASDGEVTISVDAQKVHDAQGWRVVVGQSP